MRALPRVTALLVAVLLAATGLTVGAAQGAPAAAAALAHCHGDSSPDGGHTVLPSTSPNSGNYNCLLDYGDGFAGGDQYYAVRALQEAAVLCYGQQIGIDGQYGTNTKQAVKNIQNFHNVFGGAGLTVDGVYGPNTRSVMAWPYYSFTEQRFYCWGRPV
ncbi:peptidoglycan-binding domain-containing protein [Streptodolium elevatio]|uniref:Peptidoglycan-binding domain-containing protein n=1 Tax=Streptodolium elevatio TaxID=3157996 RepID=A0ABV3DWN7_9ACTN